MDCPSYLNEYSSVWEEDPRAANLQWFADARYGMFIHYGLYSLTHGPEWAMLHQSIPVKEYERLAEHFTAHNFDADYITDLAIRAGMKYITFTTCHHEGFCMWDSKIEPYNSMNTPAKRDLVRELSEACDRKGLGFFAYYTFMLNWRHPYYVSPAEFDYAYDHSKDNLEYHYKNKEDFAKYIDYIECIIDELLSNYKITGIWLDLIAAWYGLGEDYIPIERIYDNIRRKHPGVLISWKQGATGTEDFASPENSFQSLEDSIRPRFGDEGARRAREGFEPNRHKHNEVCSTVQKGSWGYNARSEFRDPKELYDLLGHAYANNCNLLLNIGPMADGSVHPVEERILMDIKCLIDRYGFPQNGHASDNITLAGAE